mgnify:CR=1 FL=1
MQAASDLAVSKECSKRGRKPGKNEKIYIENLEKGAAKPFLFWYHRYSVIYNTKILTPCWSQGVSDHKEVRKSMNNMN